MVVLLCDLTVLRAHHIMTFWYLCVGQLYHHGDPVNVTVKVDNQSGKTVKGIVVRIRQHTSVCLSRTSASDGISGRSNVAQLDTTCVCESFGTGVCYFWSLVAGLCFAK